MKTDIRVNKVNREGIVNELSKILADEYVLYTKTQNAHWNIEGSDFCDNYEFFDAQFGELKTIIDGVAERIRILGHYVDAMLKAFLSVTQFTQQKREYMDSIGYKELLSGHESLIIVLQGNIHLFATEFHDLGTSHFITELMESHQKMAWFLRWQIK